MGSIPAFLLQHSATVETLEGTDGRQEQHYAAGAAFRCFVEAQTRRVRSQQTGQETVSSTTLYVNRDAIAGGAAAFAPGSLVTLPSGRRAEVIACLDRDGAGLPVPSHLEVQLT